MRKTPLRRKSKSPLAKLKDKLWQLCKEITRARYGNHCYTCGAYVEFPHTGHFIASSVCSTELRYDLDNLKPQCYRCNIHLSGNWLEYERLLKEEKGDVFVDQLKARNYATRGLKYDEIWYEKKIGQYEEILAHP